MGGHYIYTEQNIHGVEEIRYEATQDVWSDPDFVAEKAALHQLLELCDNYKHPDIVSLMFIFYPKNKALHLSLINGGPMTWVGLMHQLYCNNLADRQRYLILKSPNNSLLECRIITPIYHITDFSCQGQLRLLQGFRQQLEDVGHRQLSDIYQQYQARLQIDELYILISADHPSVRLIANTGSQSGACVCLSDDASTDLARLWCLMHNITYTSQTLDALLGNEVVDQILAEHQLVKIALQLQKLSMQLDSHYDPDHVLAKMAKAILTDITVKK